MQQLKSVSTLLLCFIVTVPVFAQKQDSSAERQRNNIVKINLTALVFKNISVQYERKVSKSIAIAANIHYMPLSTLPFLSKIEEAIDDPSVPVDKFKVGGFGITPEIRLYVGKKGALRGFYIAPFANYTRYKTEFPLDYSTKTGIFSGDIPAVTGGLLFGAQWKLGKSVYLDWWIIGPNYGSAKGDLTYSAILDPTEQLALRDEIESLRADAPFDKLIESYTVNGNGAMIKAKGPWAGLRGLGINIGFRF